MSLILNLISFGREAKTCSHLPANCSVRRSLSLSTGTLADRKLSTLAVFFSETPDGAERQGESLAAGPTSSTRSGLHIAALLLLPPPRVLSPFINSPHFWDNSCRVLNSARQLLSHLRARCVLIRSAIILPCMYRLRDSQSDLIFFHVHICVFLFPIHRPEPALRSFGR